MAHTDQILAHTDTYWHILAHTDTYWHILAHTDRIPDVDQQSNYGGYELWWKCVDRSKKRIDLILRNLFRVVAFMDGILCTKCFFTKCCKNMLLYLESPFLFSRISWKGKIIEKTSVFADWFLSEMNHQMVWSLPHNQKPKLFQHWSLAIKHYDANLWWWFWWNLVWIWNWCIYPFNLWNCNSISSDRSSLGYDVPLYIHICPIPLFQIFTQPIDTIDIIL